MKCDLCVTSVSDNCGECWICCDCQEIFSSDDVVHNSSDSSLFCVNCYPDDEDSRFASWDDFVLRVLGEACK